MRLAGEVYLPHRTGAAIGGAPHKPYDPSEAKHEHCTPHCRDDRIRPRNGGRRPRPDDSARAHALVRLDAGTVNRIAGDFLRTRRDGEWGENIGAPGRSRTCDPRLRSSSRDATAPNGIPQLPIVSSRAKGSLGAALGVDRTHPRTIPAQREGQQPVWDSNRPRRAPSGTELKVCLLRDE